MKIQIEIETDNDAFQDGDENSSFIMENELTSILTKLAKDIVSDGITSKNLYDHNGNHCGQITISE